MASLQVRTTTVGIEESFDSEWGSTAGAEQRVPRTHGHLNSSGASISLENSVSLYVVTSGREMDVSQDEVRELRCVEGTCTKEKNGVDGPSWHQLFLFSVDLHTLKHSGSRNSAVEDQLTTSCLPVRVLLKSVVAAVEVGSNVFPNGSSNGGSADTCP